MKMICVTEVPHKLAELLRDAHGATNGDRH